ncbi:MAG: hypothetical protein KAG64_03505 [Bacteroidales bacterium]|nr:hypothetical protein [Bacteroidales bacterium]
MKKNLINLGILAVGVIVGMFTNMALIIIGGQLIPFVEGVDTMNAELWDLPYFIFPFLAHALGTFAGAFFTAKFSLSHHFILALIVGVFFLAGGISMVFIIPAPLWFIITDLGLAYIPMSVLGAKLAGNKTFS